MHRLPIVLLSLLIAAPSFAQRQRAVAPEATKPEVSGNTVSGIVTGVQGSIIQLAGGLVQIDGSQTKISGDGGESTVASIANGSLIFAVLKSGDVAANAPLVASVIGVTRIPQATLSGAVTSVDAANNRFVLLGRTIRVDLSTRFAFDKSRSATLASLQPNMIVVVEANAANGSLLAASILMLAPNPLPTLLVHGTVKSIAADSWVITGRDGKDVTFVVNAQTKIAGSPKVGDTVDVIASVDNANRNVALSIIKEEIKPPSLELKIKGMVKSISSTSWTIAEDRANVIALVVQVTSATKISGDPKVGDHVEAVLQPGFTGFTAISITKIP